ncbi:MAG: hypothetical protein ACE3L7_29965 [Candidatus Pristimantibacillus sp.]
MLQTSSIWGLFADRIHPIVEISSIWSLFIPVAQKQTMSCPNKLHLGIGQNSYGLSLQSELPNGSPLNIFNGLEAN